MAKKQQSSTIVAPGAARPMNLNKHGVKPKRKSAPKKKVAPKAKPKAASKKKTKK